MATDKDAAEESDSAFDILDAADEIGGQIRSGRGLSRKRRGGAYGARRRRTFGRGMVRNDGSAGNQIFEFGKGQVA